MKTREEKTLDMWKGERDTLRNWIESVDFMTPYEVKSIVESRISELDNWINKRQNR